ncbi:MAG: ribosome biogenesis factor YjgA [Cycloclasticus sp.]|jgi:ribosome-associated protein|nr:ribosome biogenesis factor YjgA [Cycloclasticus sp.]MEE4291957.1 ribosome biogenesis factor YjgA [Cycloclasticus sp.]
MNEEEARAAELVSKTQIKKDAEDLVSLGKKIADLSQDQFEAMPLGDDLRQAFIVARKLSKGGAIKRQFKYIGKLLRSTDVTLINESMERQLDKDRAAAARLHNMERWRDKLVEQGDVALSDFLVSFPNADRQHIRQLQRKAKLELEKEKPPAAARKIFQYIKELSITD